MTTTTTTARDWFAEHMDHWYYCPDVETVAEGRARCALDLASAELWARENGAEVVWDHDPDADITDTDRPVWVCVLCVGEFDVAVRHGIDAYPDRAGRRVIEAELAAELFSRVTGTR
jgi:hypothetical protein